MTTSGSLPALSTIDTALFALCGIFKALLFERIGDVCDRRDAYC
jgi:hypothetical protein